MEGPEIKFRLPEFKALGKWLDKHLPFPIAFFLKGWLIGLEDKYIDAKASSSVSKAVREFEDSRTPEAWVDALTDDPIEHSEPSEVDGLDIIQITAPWHTPAHK